MPLQEGNEASQTMLIRRNPSKTVWFLFLLIAAVLAFVLYGYIIGHDLAVKPEEKRFHRFIKSLFLPLLGSTIIPAWFLERWGFPLRPFWRFSLAYLTLSTALLLAYAIPAIRMAMITSRYGVWLLPSALLFLASMSLHWIIVSLEEEMRKRKRYTVLGGMFLVLALAAAIYSFYKNIGEAPAIATLYFIFSFLYFLFSLWDFREVISEKNRTLPPDSHESSKGTDEK